MNDADIQTMQLTATGDAIARIEARGGCVHDSTQGFSPIVCRGCGRVFATRVEADQAYIEAINE